MSGERGLVLTLQCTVLWQYGTNLLFSIFVTCNCVQDLIEDVPGRTRKDPSVFSSPSDVKSVFKAVTRSSSKSYNIKDETSSKF